MKICQALKLAKAKLYGNARYAELIMLEFLGQDKAWLFLNADTDINAKAYFALVSRFARGEPFEYLFQKASFYGLDLHAKKGVLIPRFDSEILLEICLDELSKRDYKGILEIGFGSGALSIALAKHTGRKISACDISKKAFSLAKENAKLHKVEHLIDFQLCDFKKIKGKFDFIFSNPPYIARNYPLDKWVQKEPKFALFGGKNGYETLAQIIKFAKQNGAKTLVCEFGYNQRKILHTILHKNGCDAEFFKDTGDFDRAFLARNSAKFDKI